MASIITQHIEGHYEVKLAGPEEIWIKILAGKMLCDELTVLGIVLERGLIELMGLFGRPGKP